MTTTYVPPPKVYPLPVKDPETGELYYSPKYIGTEPKWQDKPKSIVPDGVTNAVAVVGHSPETLGNNSMAESMIRQVIETGRIEMLIHGCTPGTALWAAKEAIDAGIPVVSVRPWSHYSPRRDDARIYDYVIRNSRRVYDIQRTYEDKAKRPPPFPGDWVYSRTDEFVVDNAQKLFVVWNGADGPVRDAFDRVFRHKPILRYDVEHAGFILYDKEGKFYAQ